MGASHWAEGFRDQEVAHPAGEAIQCCLGDSDNDTTANRLIGYLTAQGPSILRVGDIGRSAYSGFTGFMAVTGMPTGIRKLTAAQIAIADSVFLPGSIDFSRVFVTDLAGVNGRAFVVATGMWGLNVQIMNLGTFSPSTHLLIHELTHVWQSQNHPIPEQYMVNAVASQGAALTGNGGAAVIDSSVRSHPGFPTDYPYSAYAYVPGTSVSLLAAEQQAQANANGDSTVRAFFASTSGVIAASTMLVSLSAPRIADRRSPGVVI